MRVHEEKAFSRRLEELRQEMKERAGDAGRIDYWTFVKSDSFAQTVLRAQMTSFLVSYGMALLYKKDEKITLIPQDPPFLSAKGSPLSLPIPIPQEVLKPRPN